MLPYSPSRPPVTCSGACQAREGCSPLCATAVPLPQDHPALPSTASILTAAQHPHRFHLPPCTGVQPHPSAAQTSKASKASSENQARGKQVSLLRGYRPLAVLPTDRSQGFLEAAVLFRKAARASAASLTTRLVERVLLPSHSRRGSMLQQGMQASPNPGEGCEQHPAQGQHPHLPARQNPLCGKQQVSCPPPRCSEHPCSPAAANRRETFGTKVFLPFALRRV